MVSFDMGRSFDILDPMQGHFFAKRLIQFIAN